MEISLKSWEIPLDEYPGYYATQDGDVVSYRRFGKRRVLKKVVECHGYHVVTLYSKKDWDGKSNSSRRYVHQLILEAHGFKRTSGQWQVRHLNGDKLNNHIDNLTWGSQEENYADRVEHGTDVSTIRKNFSWSSKQPVGTGVKRKVR